VTRDATGSTAEQDLTRELADAIAAYEVPGTSCDLTAAAEVAFTGTVAGTPAHDRRWTAVIDAVRRNRLEGPFAWSLADDAWPATDRHRAEAFALHERAMALTLVLERDLIELAGDLSHHGVPFRLLKGSALAHLDEPDPSYRAFGDIDLLVRGADIERAEAVLVARGGLRRYPEPRRGFDRRFSKGASFAFAHNSEVDLHRTLAAGPFGLAIDLDELFAHHEPVLIGPARVEALDRVSRFLHSCVHAVLGSASPRSASLRDIVRTAPADVDEAREALDRARRWQIDSVVAVGVEIARRRLGWDPLAELDAWATHHHSSARAHRWLAGSTGAGRSYARQMVTGIEAVPGPRNKVAYALAISLPTPSPGRATAPDRWRRGMRALRQTLR